MFERAMDGVGLILAVCVLFVCGGVFVACLLVMGVRRLVMKVYPSDERLCAQYAEMRRARIACGD